jgi:hypothetical protein
MFWLSVILELFVQFNEKMKKEQVENLLTYQIEPVGLPKNLGTTKGIVENPWLKIEFTKTHYKCWRADGH